MILVVIPAVIAVGLRVIDRLDAPAPLEERHVVHEYRVTYDVRTGTGGGTGGEARSLEEHIVRRPFEGRTTVRSGGKVVGDTISRDDGLWQYQSEPQPGWLHLEKGLYRAAGDARPVAAFNAGLEHGLVKRLRDGSVLHRRCTWVRTGAPIGDRLEPPKSRTHADLCIDQDTGVMLAERWIIDGVMVRRRTAVAFDPGARLHDGDFEALPALEGAPGETQGMQAMADLGPDTRAALPATVDVPAGFRYVGGSVVVDASSPAAALVPASQRFVERYVRGPDLLEVVYGTVSEGFVPTGERVSLGSRTGSLRLDSVVSEVLVVLPGPYLVRVRGTDPAVLIEVARTVAVRTRPPTTDEPPTA